MNTVSVYISLKVGDSVFAVENTITDLYAAAVRKKAAAIRMRTGFGVFGQQEYVGLISQIYERFEVTRYLYLQERTEESVLLPSRWQRVSPDTQRRFSEDSIPQKLWVVRVILFQHVTILL